MKIPFKELALLAGMVLSAFGIFKAVDHFAPSDIDLMADTSGALVYQAPFQKVIPDTLFTFEAGGARLVPQALFDVTGVVLGKKLESMMARSDDVVDDRRDGRRLHEPLPAA